MSRQWRSDDSENWTYGFGNGSDGDLTISSNTTETVIDSSCSGTAGSTSLSATNASFAAGQLILIHQTRGTGVGQWELAKISAYTAGTITTDKNLQLTYTDSGASQAQVRVLKQHNNVTINSGVTYTAKAWDGNVGGLIGWFAKGTTTVTGTITAVDKGFRGGSSAINNASGTFQGEGSSGAGAASNRAANGSGGGGTNSAGPSGGGGNGTAGVDGVGGSGPGFGGTTAGNATLTLLSLGGSSGGSSASATAVNGSNGAGIVLIISSVTVITGSINLNGSNGGTTAFANAGGSSGGSCLIKGVTITLGSNLISATSSTGGSQNGWTGGAGGVGRIHLDYSGSYTGTTSPTIDATLDATIIEGGSSSLSSFFLLF